MMRNDGRVHHHLILYHLFMCLPLCTSLDHRRQPNFIIYIYIYSCQIFSSSVTPQRGVRQLLTRVGSFVSFRHLWPFDLGEIEIFLCFGSKIEKFLRAPGGLGTKLVGKTFLFTTLFFLVFCGVGGWGSANVIGEEVRNFPQ